MTLINRVKILGVPVDMVDKEQAMAAFSEKFPQEGLTMVVTPNSEIVQNASKDENLKALIASADLIIPDGVGLVYASKIIGCPLKERVTGIDFLESIVAYLEKNGKSIYFFGSKPGVAETAAEKIREKYPELKVAGTHHGYFKPDEEPDIVNDINESGADFLCVALGAPKQEKFISDHRSELTVRGAIGVGGSLDVWAGNLKRAPEFYRKHGLEWLYRLIQQPSRYKRMLALPVFMLRVIFHGRSGEEKEYMANDIEMLKEKAKDIRIDIIRSIHAAASGHPGGSLSSADIITYLFFKEMNIDSKDPEKKDRDKFVLSKGHAAPALYAALAEKGFFPKEELLNLRKTGCILQGHPDKKKIPGVDMSTGSLGQGVSAACGMALANKIDKNPGRVYAVLGDGEIQEGLVWEAAMAAAHYKLDNFTVFVDWNGLQIDGRNEEVITVAPVDEKFRSFGWDVQLIDGHDFNAISVAVDKAKTISGKPQAIIAKTVKGKGVSFMEDQAGWHGKAPNDEQAKQAVEELGGKW